MYEYFKSLVQTKPLCLVGAVLVLIAIGAVVYFSSGGNSDADYQRAIGTVERAQDGQRKSIELNQSIESHIDRSTEVNVESTERITRIEEAQRDASERIGVGQERLDEAERLLERNTEIYESVESANRERAKE